MKKFLNRYLATAAALLLMLAAPTQAATRGADTDLFASVNTNTTGEANMLFIIDNGADFSKSATEGCYIDSSGNTSTTAATGYTATSLSGTSGGIMQCGLYSALNSITVSSATSFNIAIMMFNTTGIKTYTPANDPFTNSVIQSAGFSSDCSGSDGGCVVVPLTGFTSTTKPKILAWIKGWENSGNSNFNIKGPSSGGTGAIMQEAWAFYLGKTGVSGRAYTAPSSSTGCGKDFVVFVGNAWTNNAGPGDQTGSHGPKDPLTGSSTSSKNASPTATTAEQTPISGTFRATFNIGTDSITCTSGSSNAATYSTTDSETTGTYGLNWAKYMKNQASIYTYSVGLLGSTCLPSYSTWLSILASNGGREFFPANNTATLAAALKIVLAQIISVNSVFASVSLPVSVNTQGSYLNQVFIGMFRPDASFLPRWLGNLKQYKLGYVNGTLKLAYSSSDSGTDVNSAVNSSTGFITECARSYWTPTTTDSYWANATSGTCTTITGASASNYPDGNIVEKGGHAYKMRTMMPSSRVVKTCGVTLSGCSSLTNFTTTTTSGTGMGSVSASYFGSDITTTNQMNTLIDWERGLNSGSPAQQNAVDVANATTVMRSDTHGDVMHSRPVAINHGTDSSPAVVVYYGANDGTMHAVNGNQSANITSNSVTYTPGSELWSFIAPQYYSVIERNYQNGTGDPIYYTGTSSTSAKDKWYGMDGPFTAWTGTVSSVSKTYLYTTMRRGGRMLFAFDVTTPGNPSLLWRAGCMHSAPSSSALSATSSTGNTAMSDAMMASSDCTVNSQDFSSIGQTWASPKLFYARAVGSGTTPLILLAGGYDPCEDNDSGTANHNCSGSAKGTVVYVLNALTGYIVKSFNTVAPWSGGNPRPIVGDPTVVNDSSTGIAKYAYMADMGGVVYRLDFTSNQISAGASDNGWTMDAIAKLGCSSPTTSCSANRKFMFEPSVVPDPDGSTYWILLGSGDREKPVYGHVASRGVSNYFFALKDIPTSSVSTYLSSESTNCTQSVICLASLQQIDGSTGSSSASTLAAISGKKGWYLTMSSTEQIVTSTITQFGNTTFSTHQPAQTTSSCSNNLGTTRVYNINYSNAESNNGTSNRYEHVSGDGLPPSPVAGKVIIDGAVVPFCIGCSADSPLQGGKATSSSTISRSRTRLYWYLEKN